MRGGGGDEQNPFWAIRRPLGRFLTLSDIYFYCYYVFLNFFPNIKIIYSACYWPKSLLFSQSVQFDGGLHVPIWTWVKTQSCPILDEGVLRGKKRKICTFLCQSIENQKLYNISKNQLQMHWEKWKKWNNSSLYRAQ